MSSGRAVCAASIVAAVLAALPAAASGGTQQSVAGGVIFVETPRIAKVVCVKRCAPGKRIQGGSLVRFSGRSLGQVDSAIFHGSVGDDDDVRANVRALGPRRARARVPKAAVSGPISLVTSASVASSPSRPVAILPPLPSEVLAGSEHVFPIRGAYRFGGAAGQFGAGRGGRSHQGHDIFARCGTPMVAARGGRVQMAGYQGLAGNYVVIDAHGSATDYVYMHLAERSPFRRGDTVATGQRIGAVGDTGNAHGCHLHFELWAGPGYYEGGRPFDPLPALRSWARADAARRAAKAKAKAKASARATAAKLRFRQPGCAPLKRKIAKAKTRAAKRAARRAHAQCQANMKAYKQIRNAHFDGYRSDGIRIDTIYCANGAWSDDDHVRREGWRVTGAKVKAGGKRLSAIVEAWIPGGRHVQGVIREGNVWKVGYEFADKIHNAGVVTRTNAAAACKAL